jgi:hypothetical protein
VTIGNQTYIEEFLVVDQLSVDVILGDPWLRHAHVTLDYGLRCAHHGTTPAVHDVLDRPTTSADRSDPQPPGTARFPC